MAAPAIEKRLERVSNLARRAMTKATQYSSQGGWTPAEEQALRDTIDALELLIADAEAALDLAQMDLTNCLNEQ